MSSVKNVESRTRMCHTDGHLGTVRELQKRKFNLILKKYQATVLNISLLTDIVTTNYNLTYNAVYNGKSNSGECLIIVYVVI